MTVKINADTLDGLKIVSDTSGAIDLQSNGVTKVSMDSSGNVNATNIASVQPSFSAVMTNTSHQTVSAQTFTKVAFNVEEWDTDSKYDKDTNYRFTPTVAGIYQFNIGIRTNSTSTNGITLYKIGSLYRRSFVDNFVYVKLSTLAEADTDDYFEAFGYTTGTSFRAEQFQQWFQAFFVRKI